MILQQTTFPAYIHFTTLGRTTSWGVLGQLHGMFWDNLGCAGSKTAKDRCLYIGVSESHPFLPPTLPPSPFSHLPSHPLLPSSLPSLSFFPSSPPSLSFLPLSPPSNPSFRPLLPLPPSSPPSPPSLSPTHPPCLPPSLPHTHSPGQQEQCRERPQLQLLESNCWFPCSQFRVPRPQRNQEWWLEMTRS